MEQLRAESSVLDFETADYPGEQYLVRFFGRGLWLAEGNRRVSVRETHEVRIRLGASYPRTMPELTWLSPIFHPNISASGVVCLGGYGTHWVPSLRLDRLCEMLWDMIRYRNYDADSPYNRDAALWVKTQTQYVLPLDDRPIRDWTSGRKAAESVARSHASPAAADDVPGAAPEILIIDGPGDEVVDAELITAEDQDIVFLD